MPNFLAWGATHASIRSSLAALSQEVPGTLKALFSVLGLLGIFVYFGGQPAEVVRLYEELEPCPCHRAPFPTYDDPYLRPDHPFWQGHPPKGVVRGVYKQNRAPRGGVERFAPAERIRKHRATVIDRPLAAVIAVC